MNKKLIAVPVAVLFAQPALADTVVDRSLDASPNGAGDALDRPTDAPGVEETAHSWVLKTSSISTPPLSETAA